MEATDKTQSAWAVHPENAAVDLAALGAGASRNG